MSFLRRTINRRGHGPSVKDCDIIIYQLWVITKGTAGVGEVRLKAPMEELGSECLEELICPMFVGEESTFKFHNALIIRIEILGEGKVTHFTARGSKWINYGREFIDEET